MGAYKWAIIAASFLLLLFLFSVTGVYLGRTALKSVIGPRAAKAGFRISGQVIDRRTGKPVPMAHVIIEIGTREFMNTGRRCFGIIADDEGRFVAQKVLDYAIRPGYTVMAMSPDDLFGARHFEPPGLVSGEIVGQNVVLSLEQLPQWQRDQTRYDYENFCSDCTPGRNLEFLGDEWAARQH